MHGGEAGGRRLVAPSGIRPSEGRVKLAIFNMLGEIPLGAGVLDLCAGSGALGIEALSRGAEAATFVDTSPRALASIRRNLETLGYTNRARVHREDAARFCERYPDLVRGCDLVFCDPPYNDPVLTRLLQQLDHLAPVEGVVVVEHGARVQLPSLIRLRPERERRYGDTRVTILQASEEA
ncbi:MAG: 16S rRNA (guanine(966)-N(2))-methyltransferase RsmD [Candidatus Dormibacteraeota bacterium]|nr:16S rRNA (guanine(966)-N(2))-methyltransferase RsmD [Candidatus Dormibacteraeota bacterium]